MARTIEELLAENSQEDGFVLTPEEVVAKIKSLPPNPEMIRPAIGSLADYLAASIAAEDPNEEFDQEEWDRNWDAIEAEMKALELEQEILELAEMMADD
jgi:hypothetical protein